MKIDFRDVLELASRGRMAVAAFTCYDVSTALGVIRAADQRDSPIILLVSESSIRRPYGSLLVSALLAVADRTTIPVCVQLDHASEIATIRRAIEAGITSLMVDGAELPDDANAKFVTEVRSMTDHAIAIEAEVGLIEGNEDSSRSSGGGRLTNPQAAAAFVRRTNPDCLAISIGNVHGVYTEPARLDWERLERIRAAIPTTKLSLHGASGLPEDAVRRAISLGIVKVNINTDLRLGYLRAIEERIPDVRDGARVLDLQDHVIDAVAGIAGTKLDVLCASC